MRSVWMGGLVLLVMAVVSCKGRENPAPAPAAQKGAAEMALTISSSAFSGGATIPAKYTCSGDDVSPPLTFAGVPDGTKSLALIVDDPDAPAGTWTHWVIWDLPPSTPGLPEGTPTEATLPGGMKQGTNDFKKAGYGGPCPPPGKPHRYFFKLYALDNVSDLAPGSTKAALENAMKGHILAQVQLMGTYGR